VGSLQQNKQYIVLVLVGLWSSVPAKRNAGRGGGTGIGVGDRDGVRGWG
jgi:hypothetical protein